MNVRDLFNFLTTQCIVKIMSPWLLVTYIFKLYIERCLCLFLLRLTSASVTCQVSQPNLQPGSEPCVTAEPSRSSTTADAEPGDYEAPTPNAPKTCRKACRAATVRFWGHEWLETKVKKGSDTTAELIWCKYCWAYYGEGGSGSTGRTKCQSDMWKIDAFVKGLAIPKKILQMTIINQNYTRKLWVLLSPSLVFE